MAGMTQMGGSTVGGMMKPWLHFTMGDNLYFAGWVPLSSGTVVGACIGLFMLAIVERWVAAMRSLMQAYWAHSTPALFPARAKRLSDSTDKKRLNEREDTDMESLQGDRAPAIRLSHLHRAAPFIPAHDFARGAMFAGQAALSYALMLAVMTYNAGYIIAIVLGLGVGEVLFGRFCPTSMH
ncbi:Ctr copper transporter [Gautieria morchelliformis]|nr:Ctr copper transporter [Gautieria morchelliformis]